MQSSFTIKTEVYEGPLDLLLNLIEKRKLLINDISLAAVADDFINYVNAHPEFPISQAAHFILVASTLLLIKSKSLLPTLELTEEEEASVEDLEHRLKLYQRMRELSVHITERFGRSILHARSTSRTAEPLFSPDESMTIENLHQSILRVLENLPQEKEKSVKATVKKVVTLEHMIERLSERVRSSMRMSFKDFSGKGKKEKVHVVVSFLAMLELVKQGAIRVEQKAHFSDIIMENDAVGTPSYI